jgi:hypothetical protein
MLPRLKLGEAALKPRFIMPGLPLKLWLIVPPGLPLKLWLIMPPVLPPAPWLIPPGLPPGPRAAAGEETQSASVIAETIPIAVVLSIKSS